MGYKYGSGSAEMSQPLVSGSNLMNLGGVPVLLPADVAETRSDLCGDMYILAVIDSGRLHNKTWHKRPQPWCSGIL